MIGYVTWVKAYYEGGGALWALLGHVLYKVYF
jgi:hypothetical protein